MNEAPTRAPSALPVFGLVLVSLIGYLPSSYRPPLTVTIVVVLIAAGVGLPLLLHLAVRGDRTAWAGLGFATWACVSAAASGQRLAWSGEYFSGTGAIFTVA